MSWKPIQHHHAIERVRISAKIGSDLPVKFLRKLAADGEDHRLSLGFTSKNLREGHQILVGPMGAGVGNNQSQLFGWDWQKLSPANSPIETFVVENNFFVYETIEYSRWSNFIERYEKVALPSINAINSVADIKSVSLEYVDRFVFYGDRKMAKPSLFLNGIDDQLHEEAKSGAELWHLHRGWYEHINGEKILVNQNVDAQDGNISDGKLARSIQVFNKTELMINQEIFDYKLIKNHLESMHSRSKEVFGSILSDEMRETIGLESEGI